MSLMRRGGVVLLGGAIALGIWSEFVGFGLDLPARWVPDLVTGGTLIVCGEIAATRGPKNRTGGLLIASGILWFAPNLAPVGGPVGAIAARSLFLHRAPLMHAVMGFPNDRMPSRFTRGAIAVAYVAAAIPPIWEVELIAIALAIGFVMVAGTTYVRSVGVVRRLRLFAFEAAALLGGVIAVGAVARLVADRASVDPLYLLAYELALGIVGLGLLGGLLSPPGEGAAVTDLVVELGEARFGTLRGELARTLGDPSLEVRFWDPECGAFIDNGGAAVELPAEDSSRAVTILRRDDVPLAALVHDPAVLDDPGLVEAATAAAALFASNARLRAEVEVRVRELEASRRRLLDAADDERRRLERRLRDGAERQLEDLDELLARAGSASGSTREQVIGARRQLEHALEDLSRLAKGLHPRVLSELGFAGALETLATELPGPVEVDVPIAMNPDVELVAYFVCSEALANVAKHAAASRVSISVRRDGDRAIVEVSDDGAGGAEFAFGSGLRGLADRVETFGGEFRVQSEIGRGTRLIAELPLGDEIVPERPPG